MMQAGQRYISGYRRMNESGGPTWYLGVYAPESDFLGVLERRTKGRAAVAVVIAALCMGMLMTLILARRISVPLTRLASEMRKWASFN